jgi:hypothetical protein
MHAKAEGNGVIVTVSQNALVLRKMQFQVQKK